MESGTEFLTTVANDPVGFAKAIPAIATGVLTAPGRLAYDAAADVVAQIPDFRVEDDGSVTQLDNRREFGGNLRAGMTGETKPVDKFLGKVAETNPRLATAGFIGRDVAAMSPLAAVGMLPATAARLITAGFAVDMIAHAPALFEEYAAEINKPEAERNAGKISELESGIAQTFGFAPLAGAHATRGIPEQFSVAFDNAKRNLPGRAGTPVPAETGAQRSARPTEPAEEGAPVPDWVPEEARISPTPETTPAPTSAGPSRPAITTQAASPSGVGELSAAASRVTPTAAAVSPEAAAATVEVTTRHLKEARQALAMEERPPDIFDVIETHFGGAVKFPEADFKDVVARARGTAKQRMSVKEGEPADRVLQSLAMENPKYAEWTVDDLASAMLDAGETRIGQRTPNPAKVRQVAEDMARAEQEQSITDWDQAAAATKAEQNALLVGVGGSSLAASKTPGAVSFPVLLGGIDAIRPMEMPELLRLTREFAGSDVAVRKLRGHLRGYAKGRDITLNEKLFADPQQLAMTMAHEIGHVVDFLPGETLKRGNLLGRLISSTNQFLKGNFGWLRHAKVREELKALSAYWRPWDEAKALPQEKKYRNSGVELYADALSVLLNSPGLLEQKAPTFYKAFFDHLDKKPKFKEEFFALQDLLARGQEAVLGERLKQSREGFEKGEAILHEKIALREAARNSFKDFLTKVRIQSLDMADFVKRRLGSKDPRAPSEFDRLYEEWKLDDNKNAADVQRIYNEMIQPVVKAGLDEHTFGQVLELQRIRGGLDAYRDMQTMRKALGPARMDVLQKASDTLAELERKGVAEEQAIEQVAMPLERAGIPFDLIDTYRQLRETQGTRAELANPQGRSPLMAEAELNHLLNSVTPEQRAVLDQAATAFRQLIFERATEAADVGIINKLTFEKTVVPNKDTYAAFRPLDKIEPFVSPVVRRARGALQDIENPFITTLLKLQSMNNLIELQHLKNSVRDQMQQLFPADFVKAETRWTGRRREAVRPKPGEGRVPIMENGRVVEYTTDPYIAKMFDAPKPVDTFWLNKLLEVPFRLGVYPLIIKYNPGFLFAFNPRRDMARTIRNLYAVEGVTRRELLPNYANREVLGAVSDYLAGRPNPLAQAMIKNKAITTSWQGFSRFDQQDVMTDLLRRYKLAGTPYQSAAARTLMWLPDKINQAGSFLEALPKFASYKTLIERGVGPDRAAYLVRNYAGTPNFKLKGEWGSVQNSYLPFINIFLQGWRADLKLATSPRTAGGWWMQWALQHGWQAVAVGLATAGVFGDDIKNLYAGISEYDRTNYGTLPVGKQIGQGEFGQKPVYLRFPRDETSRLFSAMTYKATRAIADKAMGNAPHPEGLPTEIFAFGAGITPSPTPVLNVAGAWKDYLAGRNPIDPFRNQPVIGAREFKAGGLPAAGDMATWTLGQSGVLNLFRWNPQSETTTELVMSGTPVLNRLVKISDQGYREQQMNSERLDAQAKAKLRVQYNDAAQSLVARHAWLQSLGDKRTPEQHQLYSRLHAWKTQFYDPADEAAWNLREDKSQQRQVVSEINTAADRMQRELKTR